MKEKKSKVISLKAWRKAFEQLANSLGFIPKYSQLSVHKQLFQILEKITKVIYVTFSRLGGITS